MFRNKNVDLSFHYESISEEVTCAPEGGTCAFEGGTCATCVQKEALVPLK